jgi:EpsI family protein
VEISDRTQSGKASRGGWTASIGAGLLRARVLVPVALGVAVAVAYRSLLDYDPETNTRNQTLGSEGALFSPTGTSPQIVFGSLLWMLWLRAPRIAAGFGERPLVWLALPCLLVAGALLLWSHHTSAPDLAVLSLSFAFVGAGAWLAGRRGFGQLLVPALFLLLLVPIPSVLLNQLLYEMQMLTVWLTKATLDVLGVAAIVEGDLIRTDRGVFHVIESCAGFRMVTTLLMSAVLYAELFQVPRRRALLLLLLTPLLSIAINTLRVLSIVFNPYSQFAAVHTLQGLVMVAVGVFALAITDSLLRRFLPDETPRRVRPAARDWPLARAAVLAGSFAALGVAQWLVPRYAPPPASSAWTLSNLPLQIGAWTSEATKVDRDFLGSVAFTERSQRRFSSGAGEVEVFVGVNDHGDRSGSALSPKTRLPGAGFNVQHRDAVVVDGGTAPIDRLVVSSRGQEYLVYHWVAGERQLSDEALRGFLALDRSRWRRSERTVVVRLSTPVDRYGRGAAEERLRFFVPFVRQALADLDRAADAAPASAGAPTAVSAPEDAS